MTSIHATQRLRPALFYLLANYRLVPLPRLIHALRYQLQRQPQLKLSFSQVLIAFNDLHHAALSQLQDDFGCLDEDPLGHLLVDTGRMELRELHRCQLQAHGASVATVLARAEGWTRLLEELDALEVALRQRERALDLLQRRDMGMALFKQRLLQSGLIEPEHYQILGLSMLQYLPLRFKPLLDALVVCGEWPEYLQPAILVEHIGLGDEPLLQLLQRPGLLEPAGLARLRRQFDPAVDAGKNPAVLLAEKGLMPRGQTVMAIQQAYAELARQRLERSGSAC